MFGLKRNSPKPMPKVLESSRHLNGSQSATLPEGVQLLALEDIFYSNGDNPVLLIRAGKVVGEEQLAKLIRYGVDPKKFSLRRVDETSAASRFNSSDFGGRESGRFSKRSSRTYKSAPDYPMTDLRDEKAGVSVTRNKIVIYEPDSRSLKRILDTLSLSGVYLGDVHSVTVPEHLESALVKHEPLIVFVGSSFHVETSIFEKLKSLKVKHGIEHMLLTASVSRQRQDLRDELLDKAERAGIELVFKPVNSFALSPFISSYKARRSLTQSMKSKNRMGR